MEAAPAMRQREQRRGLDDRVWLLEPETTAAGPLRLTLTGEQQTDAPGGAAMPDVTVSGATTLERWAAVIGSEFSRRQG